MTAQQNTQLVPDTQDSELEYSTARVDRPLTNRRGEFEFRQVDR